MISLRTHFGQMEKPLLRDVYAKTFGLKGLVNNTLLLKEILKFYENKDRLSELFLSWDVLQQRILLLIARSGNRGLRFKELRLATPVGQVNSLKSFLNFLCENFVIWKSKGEQENVVYRAFAETYTFAIGQNQLLEVPEKLQSFSHGSLLEFHVCRIMSFLKLGRLRLNAGGELHRRSMQICEESITCSSKLSPKAAIDETFLILEFLAFKNWVLRSEDSQLDLAQDSIAFLNKNGFRLYHEIFHWWLSKRFNGEQQYFSDIINLFKSPVAIQNAVEIFWPLDPTYRLPQKKNSVAFEQLPRPLRELWILGILDFHVNRSFEIEAVCCKESGLARIASGQTQHYGNISALPNFELIMPAENSPRVLFYASCFAIAETDEQVLRFRFEKEYFLTALRFGFSEQEVKIFFGWLNLPLNVITALEEWGAAFFGAKIFTARILKIDDPCVYEDLSSFPQFMSLVQAPIPGYGFLIHPEEEPRIRELLSHYGLTPALDRTSLSVEVLKEFSFSANFNEGWPVENEPDLGKQQVKESSLAIESGKKTFGIEFQKMDVTGLVKALRYAKSSETHCVFRLGRLQKKNAKLIEKTVKVLGLRLSQMPFTVKIQEKDSSVEEILDLSLIQEIKLLHK